MFLGKATSANWNATYRPWLTTFAPILTIFARSVVKSLVRAMSALGQKQTFSDHLPDVRFRG